MRKEQGTRKSPKRRGGSIRGVECGLCVRYIHWVAKDSQTSARGVFESWANSRQAPSAGVRRLSDRSVDGMRWHWKSWCDFLDALPAPWDAAQPDHVDRFLRTLQGSRVVARVTDSAGQARSLRGAASGVTRMRYARLLQDVYSYALVQGLVRRNPIAPRAISAERGDSLVFSAPLLHQLITAARDREEIDWIAARDAVLVLLMSQLALTVSELRSLTLADVVHPQVSSAGPMRWAAQSEIPGTAARSPVRVQISGSRRRPHLARSLEVPQPARDALTRWLELRLAQLPAAASRARTAPLFVSRKGFGQLTAKTVFLVANSHIRRVLGPAFSGPSGELELKHAGPAALRNSCLDAWLAAPGADAQDVAERAGLKDAASLARLRSEASEVDRLKEPAPTEISLGSSARQSGENHATPLAKQPGRARTQHP
jgi:integrase